MMGMRSQRQLSTVLLTFALKMAELSEQTILTQQMALQERPRSPLKMMQFSLEQFATVHSVLFQVIKKVIHTRIKKVATNCSHLFYYLEFRKY